MTDSAKLSAPKIVIVNDDPAQLEYLASLVRKIGYSAQIFRSAAEALTAMTTQCPPALLVTDLYMPGIDGWRFCRLMRSPEYAALNRIPILVMSATYSGDEASRIAADLGVDAFLPCPVEGSRFCAQVRAILQGRQVGVPPRVLIVEDSKTESYAIRKAFIAQGYHADTVFSVKDATLAFEKVTYEVAVMDYHLPDGTGDSLLDHFHAKRPECACLMMTGDSRPELALDWMRRGAAAYLHKPFDLNYLTELCSKVRRERALLRVQDLLEVRTRELRKYEARQNAIIASIADVITIIGRDGIIKYKSPNIRKWFGWRPDEVVGVSAWQNIHPDDLDQTQEVFNSLLAEPNASANMECRYRCKDGSYKWIGFAGMNLLHDPDIQGILGSYHDVSNRKHAEAALRESENLLKESQRIAGLGSYVLHIPTGLWKSSEVLDQIFGINETFERSVSGWLSLIHPDDRAEMTAHLKEHTLSKKLPFNKEYRIIRHNDQAERWVHGSGKLRFDAQGAPLTMHGTIQDITDRRRAESEKARLESMLQQSQKMESVGRLAGGVAHDFNNMLHAILGNVYLALEDLPPGNPARDSLDEIQNCAQRATDLTRQLLAFARRQTIAPRVLDLNTTVEGLLKLLRRLIGEAIQLVWLPGADLAAVKMDPTQIDQILANLCVNARDAIGGVGTIAIETGNTLFDEAFCASNPGSTPGSYVFLGIRDNGCGMDADMLSRIFEPFFTTKGPGKGTGLGLATVYGIVKQNNGFIHVDSTPGKGTDFKIFLPRHSGEMVEVESLPTTKLPRSSGETVLLVEDEPAILAIAWKFLEKLGYTVLTATMPGEAIRLANAHGSEIHLLITDVVMPEMNGRDLAKHIMSLYPKLKYIFMSGYTADIIATYGVLDREVHFIQKPFSIEQLATKIRKVLDP